MNRKQRRAGAPKKAGGKQSPPAARSTPVLAAALKTADDMLARREWARAAALYRDILRQAPDTLPALYNLGTLLAGFYPDADGVLPDELAEAARCFEKYLRLKSGDGDAAAVLGFIRIGQGQGDDARRLMASAMQDAAVTPKTLARLGHYYRQLGDIAAAEKAFRKALDKAPALGGAWYGLSGMSCGIGDSRAQLESLWQQGAFAQGDDRVFAAFALAKAYHASGDAESAYRYYAEGNKAKRASYPAFDIAKFEKRVDALIAAFNADAVRNFKTVNPSQGKGYAFIIGMMRSGSTLVEQILASHPKAKGLGEVNYLGRVLQSMKPATDFRPDEMDALAKNYAALVAQAGMKPRDSEVVTDKLLFNFLHVGWLRLAMPAAKIIHCTRDPRDTCLSIWQLPFAGDMPWAYDQIELGRYYNAYQRLMAHWGKVFPEAMLEVSYEKLLADQQGESRRLLNYCNLDWDDRVLRFHETERAVQTASHAQVRQPLYQTARGKWRAAAPYIGPLLDTLGISDDE